MVIVTPFRAHHVRTITPQPAQAAELAGLSEEYARAMEMAGDGWTIQVDGKTVACATLADLRDGRGFLWAAIGADAGPYMLRATRIGQRMVAGSPYQRVEAVVLAGFEAGAKWMRILGFELETPKGMRAFGTNGETYMLYARIR